MGDVHKLPPSAATEGAALKLLKDFQFQLMRMHIFSMTSANATDTPTEVRVADLAWRVGYAAGITQMMSARIAELCGAPEKSAATAEPTNA
jgi:hypothetical protein